MSKVHLLSPDIISKIAAGEVIDRPASVVKELLENSLDAGSTHVEITIKQAGRSLIQIADNGSGIERDDLEKVFLRHSTSKINTFEDLFSISSLGFRGEALYSIAAVSDLMLRSTVDGQDSGWEIHMRGGEQKSLKPVAMKKGTEIKIQELFFNTPARRKFLKRDATEFSNILSLVLPYTIMHYSCRFLLHSDYKDTMRPVIDLLPAASCLDRISDVLSLKKTNLVYCSTQFAIRGISFEAYLGDQNIRRTSKDLQFVFINGRPVYHRLLSYRVNDMYRSLFPRDTYPFFALFLAVPPDQLDLNIHPAKREIKIEKEYDLCVKISEFCEEQIMKKGQVKHVESSPFVFKRNVEIKTDSDILYRHKNEPIDNYAQPLFTNTITESKSSEYIASATQRLIEPVDNERMENLNNSFILLMNEAHYLGAFRNKYLLFESQKTLLLVDQHAAQERITYESLITQCSNHVIEVQRLLAPIPMELTKTEMVLWEEIHGDLEKLGFSTTLWDSDAIALHSYPVLVHDPELAIRAVLSERNIKSYDLEALARAACRRSIMAGDYIDEKGANQIRQKLLMCSDPFICPHGRPTVVQLTEEFIDKQFLR
jgi:DNA mismatch repair protein MutL